MKFSVLIPTRNRLPYLRQAVETVRRQDYDDWELIVSDNCSEEDIGGYVRSLNDDRIKYHRADRFLPVTDNWNNALDKSTGDYVIMLGDDDGLLRGYFRAAARLADAYQNPDVIYTSAYLYSYPGGMPDAPTGYIRPYGYAWFLQGASEPFVFDRQKAVETAKELLQFRVVYGYNVQFYLVRRAFVDSLRHKGPFYQSPFPDYYATNVAFLKAGRIVVTPEPLVAIGVCPKSYGAHLNHNREGEGVKFLAGDGDRRANGVELPGSNINTSWLHAAEAVRDNYGDEFDLTVDYERYRRLQTYLVIREYAAGLRPASDVAELKRRLRWREWLRVAALQLLPRNLRLTAVGRLESTLGQFIGFDYKWRRDGVPSMTDVYVHASPVQYGYE